MQREVNKENIYFHPPSWVSKAIVYQIFPDRFRKSSRSDSQKGLNFMPWGSPPSLQGFHGGDLYGVIDSLDYLQGFGVNCIYFTPIFSSSANHRYHTYDYRQVDPILGGNSALDILIEGIHSRGMKIILDGVFNHCGRGFWPFHHVVENGQKSPYTDWFIVNNWPINPYPSKQENCGYSCWWNDPALPKFNHENVDVRQYLLDVAQYWIERGIDGWRLDVPDEVPSDLWREFRKEVKKINSEAWIIGEIWGDARSWLQGDQFDGVMNYRVGWSIISWVAKDNLDDTYQNPNYPLKKLESKDLINILSTTFNWYRKESNLSQLNLLDSHDVPRALHTLQEDIKALKIALLLLFLQSGAPCIYYGTETGLSGGIEPNCREGFPWEEAWKVDLREYILKLVAIRQEFAGAFEEGLIWQPIEVDGLIGVGFVSGETSSDLKEIFMVLINRSKNSWLEVSEDLSGVWFFEGEVEWKQKKIGPQSVVLCKR